MRLSISTDSQTERTIAELGLMGQAVRAALSKGLGLGGQHAASVVKEKYLTGTALKTRSGQLKKAVASWPVGDTEVVIGVEERSAVDSYKWLLGDEQKTIVSTKSKFLCIPIAENLTGSGVPRFTSPRQVPDGFFVRTGGQLLFGRKQGKRGRFRPLFTLVTSVLVQGSGALFDGVDEALPDMTDIMQDQVDKAVGQ